MNTASVLFELRDALDVLEKTVAKIERKEFDDSGDLALANRLHVVICKIVLAWHYRHMTENQIQQLSSEEVEDISKHIPNFGYSWVLLDGIDID